MPIFCPVTIQPIANGAFDSIDALVMACAYTSQNALGCLCDERVYENDLAARLRAEGCTDVHTQTALTATHEDFAKTYRLDLVVNQMVYELKTVAAFAPEHDVQVIHYAAMLEIDRVKLLNFRTPKVMGRLKRCPFPDTDRHRLTINRSRWKPLTAQCEPLVERSIALLRDWGAFLDSHLYEDALVHFSGREAHCVQRLTVARDDLDLGTHRVQCHAPDCAFLVTSMHHEIAAHERHLCRLLRLLPIKGWQWLNLSHTESQFITVDGFQGADRGIETKE